MRHFYLFSACAMLALPSCSSAQPARVVQVPSPHTVESTSPTTTPIAAAQPAATTSVAASPAAATSTAAMGATPQSSPFSSSMKRANSPEEVTNAAAEDTDYSFRGEGQAQSTNYSTAQREAMLLAKAALAARANEAILSVAEQISHNLSGATRTKFDDFIAGRTLALIRRTRIVCFYSKRAAMNEYAVCVEARAEDIACPIEELLRAMTQREVQEVQQAAQKVQEQPEAGSKEAVAQTGGQFAGNLFQFMFSRFLPQQ